MKRRGPAKPRYLTLEWLGGTIRTCTIFDAKYFPVLAWAPWNPKWSAEYRRFVDTALLARVMVRAPVRKPRGVFGRQAKSA